MERQFLERGWEMTEKTKNKLLIFFVIILGIGSGLALSIFSEESEPSQEVSFSAGSTDTSQAKDLGE
jgi:hypothetical protein